MTVVQIPPDRRDGKLATDDPDITNGWKTVA